MRKPVTAPEKLQVTPLHGLTVAASFRASRGWAWPPPSSPARSSPFAQEKGVLHGGRWSSRPKKIAGLDFSETQRKQLLKGLNDLAKDFEKLRKVPLPNAVPPALRSRPSCPGLPCREA